MEKKSLYPIKFIPIPSKRVWGGNSLIKVLGKEFVETDEEGNEQPLTENDLVGESWEIADMGEQDSVVSDGWLAGNTISELMETYFDRIVGDRVYDHFGRQFPLLIKFLDIHQKLSVQVHPDDEVAAQRYDSLGKSEIWYIIDAKPDAKVYMGFKRETTAQEFYDACKAGTAQELLNVIHPKAGDSIFIKPGTVHAAEGGILVAEIQESSDLTFRLYDWGRENNPATARKMHLDEAIDLIDYSACDSSLYHPADQASKDFVEKLVECPQFSVNKLNLDEPRQVFTEKFESYIVYICVRGEAFIQLVGDGNGASTGGNAENKAAGNAADTTAVYTLKKGETVLIPADMPDFYLVPKDRDTVLLEATDGTREDIDNYINPDTQAYLPDEDYGGVEEM